MLLESETDLTLAFGVAAAVGFALTLLCLVLWIRTLGALGRANKELAKTERGADHTERRLFNILNAIPVALVETDSSGRFVFANRAAHQLLGRKDAELIGLRFHSATWGITYPDGRLIPPDLLPSARALRGQTVKGFQHLIINSSTRKRMLVSVTAMPVTNDVGEVIGSTAAIVETESLSTPQQEPTADPFARKYFDVADVMLIALDPTGKVKDVNRKGAEILGAAIDDVVGKDWCDTFLPEREREGVREVVKAFAEGRVDAPERREQPVLRADGDERMIAWRNTAVRDDQGRMVALLASGEDVTDIRAAEADLQLAQDAGRVGVWWWNSRSGELRSSQGMSRLWGLPEGEHITPERQLELVHPDDRERVRDSFRAAWNGETTSYDIDYRVCLPDGEVRWLASRGEVVRDAAGQAEGMRGAAYDITDVKSALSAAQESEQRFGDIADAAPVMIWITGLDMQCTWFNRAWLEFTGRTLEQSVGDGWREAVHPDDLARVVEGYQGAFARREPYRVEFRMRRHDGEWRWVDDIGVPRLAADGEFLGFAGANTDITDLKTAAERVSASEARLRGFAEATHDVVWLRDLGTGELVYVSPVFEKLYGVSLSDLGADMQPWLDRVVPEDRKKVLDAAESSSRGEEHELEFRYVRPDGKLLVLHDSYVPIRDDQGRPRWSGGLVRDVTESRSAEAVLRDSEARFRSLVEATPELVWSTDAAGNADYLSPRWVEFTGIPEEEQLGRGWSKALHPDDLALVTAAWRQACVTGEAYEVDYRMRRHDGEWRWFRARSAPVRNAAGELVRWFGTSSDITEMVEANAALERRVVERTRELEHSLEERRRTEVALAQAQRLETVGRLTGGVAHDFNNLLTVIIGALDMMQRQADNADRVRRLSEAALAAGRRGERLTRQLLAFSRRQEFKLETLDVGRVIRGFESLIRRAVGEDVPLEVEVAPDLGTARLDPVQFEAALLNLVMNAKDAVEGGGGIVVRAHPVRLDGGEMTEVPGGDYVRVAVIDTGVGMSPDVVARAVEPFFTTKEVGKGTGLGLAQVYGFARQSGGGVMIESTPGQGSTVCMYLPLGGAVGETEPTPDARREERPLEQGKLVLLVEDDLGVRTVAESLLAELGCRVITASDGPAALEVLKSDPPIDLLLTDIVMPGGMSGVDLADEARRNRPDLRVLLSTGYAGERLDEAADRGWSVLRKPYLADDLSQAVRQALG